MKSWVELVPQVLMVALVPLTVTQRPPKVSMIWYWLLPAETIWKTFWGPQ